MGNEQDLKPSTSTDQVAVVSASHFQQVNIVNSEVYHIHGAATTSSLVKSSKKPQLTLEVPRENPLILDRVPTIYFDQNPRNSKMSGSVDNEELGSEDGYMNEEAKLEEQGFYEGSYSRLLSLYTLVPLTSLVTFACIAVLPTMLYPSPPSKYPYAPFLPFPLPEIFLSASIWSFSYLLRDNLCAMITFLASYFPSIPLAIPIIFSTGVHTAASLLLMQATLPLLLVSLDTFPVYQWATVANPAFKRVWWIALGWALAESLAAIKQGYDGIALYRGVLVSVKNGRKGIDLEAGSRSDRGKLQASRHETFIPKDNYPNSDLESMFDPSGNDNDNQDFDECDEHSLLLPATNHYCALDANLKLQVDRDFNDLIELKSREELEEIYGIPMIRIPVFISCLQRINAVLMPFGVFLLLSHAYIHLSNGFVNIPNTLETTGNSTPMFITFPVVVAVQFGLTIMHTSLILPVLGVPTVVYTSSLVSLSIFFAGLGIWEGLS